MLIWMAGFMLIMDQPRWAGAFLLIYGALKGLAMMKSGSIEA